MNLQDSEHSECKADNNSEQDVKIPLHIQTFSSPVYSLRHLCCGYASVVSVVTLCDSSQNLQQLCGLDQCRSSQRGPSRLRQHGEPSFLKIHPQGRLGYHCLPIRI